MRTAFFGGSFDPPHLGHLAVAEAARDTLRLDRVLFAPVGLQPLKSSGSSASFEDRVAMTRLAIQDHRAFELSLLDAPAPTPNYTIDTLARLRSALPQGAELFLLLGADTLRTLHHWRRAAEIPFAASLIIAARPVTEGDPDLSHPDSLAQSVPRGVSLQPIPDRPNHYRLTNSTGAHSQLIVLPGLHVDISATDFRHFLHSDPAHASTLVPPAVFNYIQNHKLYP